MTSRMTVDLKPYGLHRREPPTPGPPGAFYANLDFSEPVAHCLLAGILGDHLRGVGGALARALETAFARARPSDDSPFRIRDTHDGVVETGLNVSNAMDNVLAALGLDDLQGLNAVVQ